MRKVVAITYVTLDGVMQSPGAPEEDPRNGFTYGGWMVPYFDETLGKLFLERNVTGTFDLLLGRRTYEMLAAHWPYAVTIPSLIGTTKRPSLSLRAASPISIG